MDTPVSSQPLQTPVADVVPAQQAAAPPIASQAQQPRHPRFVFPLWAFLASLILLVAAAALAIILLFPGDSFVPARQWMARYILHSDYIQLENQNIIDGKVLVKRVSLRKSGYLVVRLSDSLDSSDTQIGMWALPAGEFVNVPIAIDLNYSSSLHPSPIMQPGDRFFVGMYYDDGDELFNAKADTIAKNSLGDPTIVGARVL